MKWFKWLRRPKTEHEALPQDLAVVTMASTTAGRRRGMTRSEVVTHPLTTMLEPRDELLRFARDYLVASGARVQVEDTDVLSATLADGRHVRYTTSPARARNEEQSELLVQGGDRLSELLDDCAGRARVVALRLWETVDPLDLAQDSLAGPLPACTGCSLARAIAPGAAMGELGDLRQHCERCPAREGKTVLEGFGPIASSRLQRRIENRSVELTYHVVSTDRSGRHDEWTRVAFDLTSGHAIALLSLDSVLRMETDRELLDDEALEESLPGALVHAEAFLAPQANALARFLRLRDAEDYQRRCDDISTTYDRLVREAGSDSDGISEALQRERMRLADAYAVNVDVQLDSVALITSQVAEVALRDKAGKSVTAQIDLGRACMLPLRCASCGSAVETASCCSQSHVVCAVCMLGSSGLCPICAAHQAGKPIPATSRLGTQQPSSQAATYSQGERLSIGVLDAMSPDTWHLFIAWLLERMGYLSQRSELNGTSSRFSGESDGLQFTAAALRLESGVAIGPVEVQNVAALRAGDSQLIALLLSSAPATREAAAMAERLGVRVLDRSSLITWLERLEAAHSLEVAAEVQATQERAVHAETIRGRLLADLDVLEDELSHAVNTRKAVGRAALLSAVEAITSANAVSTQVFLAWETLATDWTASFGEHEERDGSLLITEDPASLVEIGERAQHLAAVTKQALERIQNTPGTGELGYTAWRKAVLEELVARFDALRLRIGAVSPSDWHDFREARNVQKLQQAEEAATMATYARGRADKALAQLQTRARIVATDTASTSTTRTAT